MNNNPLIEYIAGLEARFSEMAAKVKQLEERLSQLSNMSAEIVVGPTAAAAVINRQTVLRPISPKVITNYAGAGKIPTAGMVGSRYSFRTAELIEWDRAGRPAVKEFLKARI